MYYNTGIEMYLILCVKNGRSHRLGQAVWWRPESSGYTFYVDEAGRYTKEECDTICAPGENIAVPEAEVIVKAKLVVIDFHNWEDEESKRKRHAEDAIEE